MISTQWSASLANLPLAASVLWKVLLTLLALVGVWTFQRAFLFAVQARLDSPLAPYQWRKPSGVLAGIMAALIVTPCGAQVCKAPLTLPLHTGRHSHRLIVSPKQT